MFIDRKTQYCQKVSSSQLNEQIQGKTHQNPGKSFSGYQQMGSKVSIEKQKIQNSQHNIEEQRTKLKH